MQITFQQAVKQFPEAIKASFPTVKEELLEYLERDDITLEGYLAPEDDGWQYAVEDGELRASPTGAPSDCWDRWDSLLKEWKPVTW